MLSQLYYVLRSRQDGQYLAARDQAQNQRYLLLFTADYDALSYLNAHAPDAAEHFAVASVTSVQLKTVLDRWGYQGMGLVKDPRLPRIEFMARQGP